MLFANDSASNSNIVDIDQNNAQTVLIEGSQQQFVLAHFWSPRSAESVEQNQLLEQLNNEYQGQFVLAKVNADELGMIAQQLGVQSLPTALLFQAGQPVDGFAGAQTETQTREFLEKFLPKPWDLQYQQALIHLQDNDELAAIDLLEPAYLSSAQRPDIGMALCQAYIGKNRLDEAEAILTSLDIQQPNEHYQQLLAAIADKRNAAVNPEILALVSQLETDQDNLALHLQLANAYIAQEQFRQGCESLIHVLRQDKNFDGARATLLAVFKTLGNKDPLTVEFQRQLFSLLY